MTTGFPHFSESVLDQGVEKLCDCVRDPGGGFLFLLLRLTRLICGRMSRDKPTDQFVHCFQ